MAQLKLPIGIENFKKRSEQKDITMWTRLM